MQTLYITIQDHKITCKTTSTWYELPLLFWYPRNCAPLYRSEVATPGWWVLIGAGGTREAEDRQADRVVPRYSARTGMTSDKVPPSATVMSFVTGNTAVAERKSGCWQRRACQLRKFSELQNFAQMKTQSENSLLPNASSLNLIGWELARGCFGWTLIGKGDESHSGYCIQISRRSRFFFF